jgi:hypothetical protein
MNIRAMVFRGALGQCYRRVTWDSALKQFDIQGQW